MKWMVNTKACLAGNYPDGMPVVTVNFMKGFPALEKEAEETAKRIAYFPEILEILNKVSIGNYSVSEVHELIIKINQ